MNILMISIDKGLLGKNPLGDVIERHKLYGEYVKSLDIIVQTPTGYQPNRISDKVKVFPTNSKSRLYYTGDTKKIATNLFSKKKYDLIVTQDPFLTGLAGVSIKQQFGSKLLIHLHGDYIDDKEWLRQQLMHRLLQRLGLYTLKHADAIRTVSNGIKEKLIRRGFQERHVHVIPTPVDLSRFTKGRAKEKPWKKVVTMVGRLDPVKDFGTLFAAMDKVLSKDPDVGLYLVGNYTEKKDVPLPKERVKLFGNIPTADLPDIYAATDVLLLTSISESFGKVLVEAAASGVPVVSTDTTGARDIIQEDETGYLCPIGDEVALSEKVLHLLNDSNKANIMGANGKKYALEKYNNVTPRIIDLWKSLISDTI